MFHRFSATPAKARSQSKGSGSTRTSNKNGDPDSNHSSEDNAHPLAKRQKTARACDRCRQLRIKCDEQKPCAQCVGTKAKCIVSYATAGSSEADNSETDQLRCEPSSAIPPSLATNTVPVNFSVPLSRVSLSEDSTWATAPADNVHKQHINLASHIQGFFTTGQSAFSHTSAPAGCLFPQLPYPAVPSGERALTSNTLLKTQRSYYLRLFWDVCHPLLQIMGETEFAELDALQPPTMFDEYSPRAALADSMIALGIQHSHAAGLAGRILGLQQPLSWQSSHTNSSEDTWPGFGYFYRSRECMRTAAEVTLDVLRCHVLLALYFIKGNAFCDAHNLLGITVRKAYIAKLHRQPPSHLPEAEKTARMQLWWILFSLDIQCSLHLDMPPASQKNLIKCPVPTEDALARFVSPNLREEVINPYAYSINLINLSAILADIGACVSTADLDDEYSPAALEQHALNLLPALKDLQVWRDQLPQELLLSRCGNGSGTTAMLAFDRDLALPAWLQRQTVLLELHYHNAYTLIQRPFTRLHHSQLTDANGVTNAPESRQRHVELHIASALDHAIAIVDTVFTVSSISDVFYGWSDVLQPLWNATLTILAYVYANPLSSEVPRALDSITRAQAVFESFAPTCPTALSAKEIVQSLANSLQHTLDVSGAAINDNPIDWDFASLLAEQQLASLESASSSNNLYGSMPLSTFMPEASQIDIANFNPAIRQFGDS